MMRINLLPIKAAKRHDVARNELLMLVAVLVVLILGLYYWYASVAGEIEDLQLRLNRVTGELQQLKMDVDRVEDFKKSVELLERKNQAISALYRKRFGPARMLDDLATIMTTEDKVWLTELVEKDGQITLTGGALGNENVSEFQLALERRSELFKEVRLSGVKGAKSGKIQYVTWTITCKTDYAAG